MSTLGSRALLMGVVLGIVSTSACVTRRERLTPTPSRLLPDGIGIGQRFDIELPGDARQIDALAYYLTQALERGAIAVSALRIAYPGGTCHQSLMPPSVRRNERTAYLEQTRSWGGKTRHDVIRQDRTVEYPYVREIDNFETMLREFELWRQRHLAFCRPEQVASKTITGLIHGREPLGLLPGAAYIDLSTCGARSAAGPETATTPPPSAPLALLLNDPNTRDEVERILPEWIGAPVRVLHGDDVVEGTLVGYAVQVMSVERTDGTRVDIPIGDALAIERERPAKPLAPRVIERSAVPCPPWLEGVAPGTETY